MPSTYRIAVVTSPGPRAAPYPGKDGTRATLAEARKIARRACHILDEPGGDALAQVWPGREATLGDRGPGRAPSSADEAPTAASNWAQSPCVLLARPSSTKPSCAAHQVELTQ